MRCLPSWERFPKQREQRAWRTLGEGLLTVLRNSEEASVAADEARELWDGQILCDSAGLCFLLGEMALLFTWWNGRSWVWRSEQRVTAWLWWFSTLAAQWICCEVVKKLWCLSLTLSSKLTGSPGIKILKTSPGDFNVKKKGDNYWFKGLTLAVLEGKEEWSQGF